jgi:flagellar hook-length control protein FliK
MSVERSSTPGTPKASAAGEAGHVKGKGHAVGGGDAPDAGGFSALLTMLGAGDAGDVQSDQSSAGQTVQVQDAPLDPNLLLAQAVQRVPGLPVEPGTGHLPNVAEVESKPVALNPKKHGLVELDTGSESGADNASLLQAMEKGLQKQAAPADVSPDASKDVPVGHHGASKNHWVDDDVQSGKARLAAQEHANKLLRAEDTVSKNTVLPQLTVAAGTGESGLKQAERVKERLALKQIGGSEGGAWGHQALVQAGRIEPPSAPAGASVLSPEMMVAEQVNYWISRDVQSAELKLDGLGDSAIKVSISLSGNEARVDFRTDEAQTRQVLEGAVSHLKHLLGSEGLVLSSVSVGTSGSGAADSRQGRPPPQSRQVVVALPEALGVDLAVRPAGLSGRTVDLFV